MHLIGQTSPAAAQLTKIKTFIGLTKLGAALCNEEKEEAKKKVAAAISRHSLEEDTE
jgi:hypothetical protein